jgi:hypothetical protein
MNATQPLRTEPADPTPDHGPSHRGGPSALFFAIFCAFSAAGILLLFWREGMRLWAILGAFAFGSAASYACWCLVEHWRSRHITLRSHLVLTGTLAFDIRCTCRDVAATVFFEPDQIAPGATSQLLCFIENYGCRRRIARFRIGPHAPLGLAQATEVALELAPGQAAVYALPLTIAASLPPGEHDLPIELKVDKPNGTGARLPNAPRHLHDLWKVHFAAPFTVPTAADYPPHAPAPLLRPRFISLASASAPVPDLSPLADLIQPPAPRP